MKKTFNEINITPLTDIFLVLLIIMMVVAPMLDQQGIGLTVPENVEQTKMDKESKILTVTVTSNNKYYIHNVEVPADNLGNVLSQEIKNYPDGLLIETDGNSNHGTVVKLMDKAREVGVNAISLDQI
ncbi:MAG: biopolymer transporter ExbD [Candidatus Gastranaerophilaceae bacterium]|jgi:biopolymer transport protein ExbD|nr:biopolymer transporter ExbD [bacterium]MEE0496566.1 biopolymer transporter ExbD [Cyanobacteriota bacterium]CDE92102.1 exbD/TolR family protein [Fusobacterium sp. CAG:815]DAA91764.1 MAG TPA: biopolymer transporter ExbD [Candidatus Gastranaerophilales bacterium HUM_7]DAA91795.1 MAG TPA: biopolymer transporter ExbD [Candidatus Gastranaerophilales bacterium HUM_6]DAB04105.1 MAG TPA: biopolymer transporter ExbD [Candidatus Gastranaerophilales bacterium HUM_12]DAB05365.1 MAG TPA: biopolymer tran